METLFQKTRNGLLLSLKVFPGAGRDEVQGMAAGALRVKVSAPPDKGTANKAVLELLAKWLGTSKSSLSVQSGETSRQKKILLPEHLEAILVEKLKTLKADT